MKLWRSFREVGEILKENGVMKLKGNEWNWKS
jgi:hypothetical protein